MKNIPKYFVQNIENFLISKYKWADGPNCMNMVINAF